MKNIAVKVEHVSKKYTLYSNPIDRMKEALSIRGRKYGKTHYALDDISFSIQRGETVGIVGKNGSGKSTLLKLITGVLTQTRGEIAVAGKVSALLELGAGFNPEYTGRENIYLNGTMMGYSRTEMDKKIRSIIDFADIGEFIDQPVKTYSSGMFARLAFAVAINVDPDILIVDEALSVGDVFFQAKCFKKFEDFKKQGKTILFVSHDLSSIIKYCDRAFLLEKGKLLQVASAKLVVDSYKKILVHEKGQGESRVYGPEKRIVGREKDRMNKNPQYMEYGDGRIEIVDYSVENERGEIVQSIVKGRQCRIKMRVQIHEKVENPIFAFTIKDSKGTEICGTNTMYEGIDTSFLQEGNSFEVSFLQDVNLQGGEYLLSLGCTGFEGGEFVVYHRLYDLFSLRVLSEKNTVGYFDMNSRIEIKK